MIHGRTHELGASEGGAQGPAPVITPRGHTQIGWTNSSLQTSIFVVGQWRRFNVAGAGLIAFTADFQLTNPAQGLLTYTGSAPAIVETVATFYGRVISGMCQLEVRPQIPGVVDIPGVSKFSALYLSLGNYMATYAATFQMNPGQQLLPAVRNLTNTSNIIFEEGTLAARVLQ